MKIQATVFAAALALVPAIAQAQSSSTGSTGSSSNTASSNTGSSTSTSSGMPTNDTKTSATSGYQPIGSQPPSQTTGVGSARTSSSDRSSQTSSDRDHDMMNKKLDQTQLLQKLHHVNQEEIKAGQLAEQKGSSSDVKDYGKMLVKDHQQADRDLTALAGKVNVDLSKMKMDQESREKREVHQDKMEQLQKLTGKEFDRGFAQMMVNGHQHVIELIKNSESDVKPEVKASLDKMLPVLQKHEDMAKDILNKVGNTASAR
jgi:putative membrane protein